MEVHVSEEDAMLDLFNEYWQLTHATRSSMSKSRSKSRSSSPTRPLDGRTTAEFYRAILDTEHLREWAHERLQV